MRILILAAGRDRNGPTADLVADYQKRCPWAVEVIDFAARRQLPAERRLAEEAAKFRQLIPAGSARVALDEKGEDLTSRALAKRIDRMRHRGGRTICFMIGGADGLDRSLLAEADLRIAFGRTTWPHRLVRVMLVEQIYRASMILSGHPYHRD